MKLSRQLDVLWAPTNDGMCTGAPGVRNSLLITFSTTIEIPGRRNKQHVSQLAVLQSYNRNVRRSLCLNGSTCLPQLHSTTFLCQGRSQTPLSGRMRRQYRHMAVSCKYDGHGPIVDSLFSRLKPAGGEVIPLTTLRV